jgi:hypothetical protein
VPETRGRCAVCGNASRLRKDGTLGAHHQSGQDCEGAGQPPKPYNPNECIDCAAFYYGTPGLMEAIWSVAIESPKPGGQIAYEFLKSYHLSGHRGDFLDGG